MFEGLFKRNAGLGNTEVIKENIKEEKRSGLLVHNQRVAIDKISRSIEDTGSATGTLINIIGNISKNMDFQVESINNVIDKIEEYSALAEEVFSRTSDSQRIAGEALQTAEQGNTAVDNIIKSMNGIEASVDYIKEVVGSLSQKAGQVDEMLDIIKDIAGQTNLLSLNASIEAARAGEHGRGFAVVADEVRKLAQKSNESVNKISNTIKGINESIEKAMEAAGISGGKVREGVATAADTIEAFKKIIDSINTTVSVTGEISAAVSEQTGHLEEVISSAGEMKKLSEKVMSMIEVVLLNTQQTESSIEMLNLTSKELVEITSKILGELSSECSSAVLKTCIRQKLESMDPAVTFNQETSRIFSNVHRGLLAPGLNADIIPGIAKSWYVEDDNLTWVFNLRKGVKFQNGREVTAEDVKYSLERVLNPSLNSPNAWFLLPIDGAHEFQGRKSREVSGIRVLDRYRVSIRLMSPYAGFLLNLSQTCCSIMAREDVEKGRFTGCGPYVLEEMGDGNYLLTGFRDCYGGCPYVDRVEISYGDEDMAGGIINGKYNFVIFANNSGLDEIKKSSLASNLKSRDVMTTTFAGFNLRSNSVFAKNKELRKAINYAVNRKRIIEDILKGLAKEAKGVFPPSIIDNDYLAGFSYNPEKAKGILRKEGFSGSSKRLVILGWKNDTGVKSTNERIVEYIIEDLKAVGIECDVLKVPSSGYLNAENVSKCDLFIMGWVADTGDPDNYLEPLFNPDNYTNFTGYDNKEIISLMSQAKEIINPEKRINMYRKIQDMIIEDAPWIFLHHPVTVYAYADGVGNIRLNPMGKVRFEDIIISEV